MARTPGGPTPPVWPGLPPARSGSIVAIASHERSPCRGFKETSLWSVIPARSWSCPSRRPWPSPRFCRPKQPFPATAGRARLEAPPGVRPVAVLLPQVVGAPVKAVCLRPPCRHSRPTRVGPPRLRRAALAGPRRRAAAGPHRAAAVTGTLVPAPSAPAQPRVAVCRPAPARALGMSAHGHVAIAR